MRRVLRLALTGGALFLAGLGAGYWYFLHYPAPELPRLGADVQHGKLQVEALTRSYLFYLPAKRPSNPPLLLALHGSTGNAEQMRKVTAYGFERLADEHGFVVVYPEGYERHWNDCRKTAPYSAKRLGIDDTGFLRALIGHFHAAYGVDTARVFAVGYSNGGHLGYRLALEAPELIRAVAVVGANLPAEESSDCTPAGGAAPVMILNGTDDPINPFEGGRVTLFGFGDRGRVRSARESAMYFARRNGATEAPIVEQIPQQGSSSPTSAQRALWRATTGAEVVLYTIHGGGHTLPQPHARFPRILGRTHPGLDGPAEIWRFFTRHGAAP